MNTGSSTEANSADPTAADALAILTIPQLGDLTERQVRGITCVWDAAPLTNGVAVDLGVRKASRAGQPVSWYPRACRPCVAVAAVAQLHTHANSCDNCRPDDNVWCDITGALARLVTEYQR